MSKSEGRSSVRRLVGRTEEFAQSRATPNVTVPAARLRLLERWRSTERRGNGRRRPGRPTALQADRSYRNNRGGRPTASEQAPGATASKAWSGLRAGASAPSGRGTSHHGRKQAPSPSRCRPIERWPATAPTTKFSALRFAISCQSHCCGMANQPSVIWITRLWFDGASLQTGSGAFKAWRGFRYNTFLTERNK